MAKNKVQQVRGAPRFPAPGSGLAAFVPEITVSERQNTDGSLTREVFPAGVIELREGGLARRAFRDPNQTAVRLAASAALVILLVGQAARSVGLSRGR